MAKVLGHSATKKCTCFPNLPLLLYLLVINWNITTLFLGWSYFLENFWEIGDYFPEVFQVIADYFPDVFREKVTYFPEVVFWYIYFPCLGLFTNAYKTILSLCCGKGFSLNFSNCRVFPMTYVCVWSVECGVSSGSYWLSLRWFSFFVW